MITKSPAHGPIRDAPLAQERLASDGENDEKKGERYSTM